MNPPRVNPKLNPCLILYSAKTPLAVYAVLSLQLLYRPHQFIVYHPSLYVVNQ